MTVVDLIMVAGVVFAGAVLQSFTGFGFALIVAPLAALIAPDLVPGPVIALTLVLTLSYTVRMRRLIDWSDFGFIMLGRLPFTLVAAIWMANVDANWIGLAFGLFLLASVAVTWSRVSLRTTPAVLAVAGGLSGFFGTLTSVGAPPLAIAYQNRRGPEIRATLGANIILGAAMSLFALGAGGHLDIPRLIMQAALALPVMLVGMFVGGRLSDKVDPEALRRVVLIVCAISAFVLTLRAGSRLI